MRNKVLYIFFYLTICASFPISAQPFSIINYTVNDGLPSNQIVSTYEDSFGFLWIGTSNGGLSRFNGKNFVNYGYMEGLQDLYVNAIYEDSSHRLWIGTLRGISELKGGRFVTYHTNDNAEFVVWKFQEMEDHELWAATSKGIYRFADSVWMPVNLNTGFSISPYVHSVQFISTNDGIYINYGDHLVLKKKKEIIVLGKNITDLGKNHFNDLLQINNRIFINTKNCLYEVVHQQLKLLINDIPASQYFTYYVDIDNNFWFLIANKGIYCYRSVQGTEKKLSFVYNMSNAIGYPFADKDHNLWLASYDGLIRIQPKNFTEIYLGQKTFNQKEPLIVPAGNNQLLIFAAHGLQNLNDDHISNLKLPSSYNNLDSYLQDVVEGADKDGKNNIWFITRFKKLFRWNGSSFQDFSDLLPLQHDGYIYDLAVDPVTNRVFLCGDTTILVGNEKHFGVYRDNKGITFPKSTSVLFTRSGIGIINVFLKGVYFITKHNEIIKAPPELDIVEKGNYTYFYEDRQGCIWVSNAGKGLIKFTITNDYKVKDVLQFNTSNGLPNNKIVSVAFDTKQNIWVNTNKGVVVLQNANKNFSALNVYTMGKEQGIVDEASLVGQIVTDDTGNVWISAMDRVLKFNSNQLQFTKANPQIVIEKVMLNMKETDWTLYGDSVYSYFEMPYHLSLAYSQNSIGIQFIGTCLTDASHMEYSYRLEPLDTGWSSPSSNDFVSILNLSPGTYTFHVKAKTGNLVWSEPVSYTFTIRQPYWETWWFISLIGLIIIIAINALFQFRLKQKIKILIVRQRLHRDLHDDVGATLSSVKVYSEILQTNTNNSLIIELIKSNATEMIDKLEVIAWATNPQHDTFKSFKELMHKYASPVCFAKNIELDIECNGVHNNMMMPGDVRQNLFFIFKEAINNTIKYSEASRCNVHILIKNSKFYFEIRDNGNGFNGIIKGNGTGWKNIRKRIEELNGKITIDSKESKGTIINIILRYPFKIPSLWDKSKYI